MSTNRLSAEYRNGVEFFIRFCMENMVDPNDTFCPCVKCGNVKKLNLSKVKEHLFFNGIDKSYNIWYSHGENPPSRPNTSPKPKEVSEYIEEVNWDPLDEMIEDAHYGSTVDRSKFDNLLSDAEKPLYPGYKKFTKLSAIIRLFNMKAKHGWSDTNCSELLIF
jgi:hypothetical protein